MMAFVGGFLVPWGVEHGMTMAIFFFFFRREGAR